LINKLDKQAEKVETDTPNSTRHALKRRVDSTPVSGTPENAPVWAVARSSPTTNTLSDTTAGEDNSQELMPQQTTPEVPPGVTANPRRLDGTHAFQELYGRASPSSSSDSDTD
jgi:hypothetical protein